MDKKNNQNSELDNSLKLIIKSSFMVFILIIFSKIFSYAFRAIIARHFGPEIYGVYSLSLIIFLWFVLIFSFGVYDGALRFIALYRGKEDIERIKVVFRFSITILFGSSILSGLLLYIFSNYISLNIFHNIEIAPFLKILSFAVPFQMMAYIFLTIIQAYERTRIHSFISDFLLNLINLLALLILLFAGLGTNALVLSISLGFVAIFIISFLYCRYSISEIFQKSTLDKKSRNKIKKELLAYSWPLIFSGVLYGILPVVDSIALGYLKGVAEVGLYGAAVPIAELTIFFPILFLRLYFPLINRTFSNKNFELIGELTKQVTKWILIANLPIFILILLFPGVFINLLFGSQYIGATTALRFLIIGFIFYSFTPIFSGLIAMVGKSKIILLNIVLTAVLNILLVIFLIPRFGINGAAFATMISYIVLTAMMFLQVRYYISIIPFRRKVIRIVISAIISTIILILIKPLFEINLLTMIIQGVLFMGAYLILIILTKSLDKNDLMIIETVRRKLNPPI